MSIGARGGRQAPRRVSPRLHELDIAERRDTDDERKDQGRIRIDEGSQVERMFLQERSEVGRHVRRVGQDGSCVVQTGLCDLWVDLLCQGLRIVLPRQVRRDGDSVQFGGQTGSFPDCQRQPQEDGQVHQRRQESRQPWSNTILLQRLLPSVLDLPLKNLHVFLVSQPEFPAFGDQAESEVGILALEDGSDNLSQPYHVCSGPDGDRQGDEGTGKQGEDNDTARISR